MIVLGVDPGSVRTGWGAIETDGRRHRLLDKGVIAPPPRWPLPSRLRAIHDGLAELLERLRPDVLAVEDVFHSVNTRTALVLGHVRGVILLAGAEAGLPDRGLLPRHGEGPGHGLRPRREGAGGIHGDAAARALGQRRRRVTRRMPSRWRCATPASRPPRAGWRDRPSAGPHPPQGDPGGGDRRAGRRLPGRDPRLDLLPPGRPRDRGCRCSSTPTFARTRWPSTAS